MQVGLEEIPYHSDVLDSWRRCTIRLDDWLVGLYVKILNLIQYMLRIILHEEAGRNAHRHLRASTRLLRHAGSFSHGGLLSAIK